MKTLYSFLALVLALLALSTVSTFAQTNATPDVATTVKQTVSTNINQVMVEILSGVKDASGEAYKFSKKELGQGYDFLKKEAPQVLEEFLKWQVAKSIIYIIIAFAVACILYYVTVRIGRYADGSYGDETLHALKWMVRLAAIAMFIAVTTKHGMTVTKIAVAPRVYIIQYVMDVASGKDVSDYR